MLDLNPTNTAVIVVDIQRDFNDPALIGPDKTDLVEIANKISNILPTLKQKGYRLIYTQYLETDNVPQNILNHNLQGKCQVGTPGADLYLINQIKPDLLIEKYTWDAFTNPQLLSYLANNKISNLIIFGGTTHTCVFSTVSRAFAEGFNVTVVADLCACRDSQRDWYEATLKIMAKYYASVINGEELV